MALLNMTRRTFTKAAVATGAALILSSKTQMTALAKSETATEQGTGEIKHIRTCCRGCGKMECGVWVTVKDGVAIKVEGDESSYGSEGNCCIKSQSSIHAMYHPDRLRFPMKRTNPKGDDDPGWVRLTWDEAYDLWEKNIRQATEKYGTESYGILHGTSRFQANCSMGFSTGGNAANAGAGEICKGPRRFVGHLCLENGAYFFATIDRPRVYVQWGTDQTQSNYDDSCRVTNETAQRADIFISVDPRVSNCGKEADYHLPLRPETDGAMALGWLHEMIDRELYDDLYTRRWSNAPFLYCEDIEPTGWDGVKYNQSSNFEVRTRLLKESDLKEDGDPHKFMVWDEVSDGLIYFNADENSDEGGFWQGQTEADIATTGYNYYRGGFVPDMMPFPVDISPALWGEYEVTLKDGRTVKCKTVMQKWWDESLSKYDLKTVEEITGVDADLIDKAFTAWITRFDPAIGNGGINFQLAPEQGANSTMNFRALYALFFLSGNYDIPGSNRGMARCPISWSNVRPKKFTPHGNLGNDAANGILGRIYQPGAKQFPMLAWHTGWTDCHYTFDAMRTSDPYRIATLHSPGADLGQQVNTSFLIDCVKELDWYTCVNLWHTCGGGFADLLLPACHWMELPVWTRMCQGANGNMGAAQQCVENMGDTKFEQYIYVEFCRRFDQPFYDPSKNEHYGVTSEWDQPITAAWDTNVHKRRDGASSGDDYLFEDWEDFRSQFDKNSWFKIKELQPKTWGTYRRFQQGYMRQGSGNFSDNTNDWKQGMPTPTMKFELWTTITESVVGNYATDESMVYADPRMKQYSEKMHKEHDMLPFYLPPYHSDETSTDEELEEYPFTCTTGARVAQYFHSEHRNLPWCRESWPTPRVEINPDDAAKLGIEQGDWCWIESPYGSIRQTADLTYGVKPGICNCNHQWTYPELTQADKGTPMSNPNNMVDPFAQDPWCGSSQLRGYKVKIYKATPENSPFGNPVPCGNDGTPIIYSSDDQRLKDWYSNIKTIQTTGDWESIGDREVHA